MIDTVIWISLIANYLNYSWAKYYLLFTKTQCIWISSKQIYIWKSSQLPQTKQNQTTMNRANENFFTHLNHAYAVSFVFLLLFFFFSFLFVSSQKREREKKRSSLHTFESMDFWTRNFIYLWFFFSFPFT